MPRIKHLETRIMTVFCLEDSEGNITEQYVVQAQNNQPDPLLIKRFNEEAFKAAFQTLTEVRTKLEENANNKDNISQP